jgi:hypothetical protein
MWKPVERGVKIPVELETSYLHVKTNSEVESEDETAIYYYDKEGGDAGGIKIWFIYALLGYNLKNCQSSPTPFTHTVPTTVNKVWTFEKRGYRTRMFCNRVLVLEITVSDTTCDHIYWETYWGREVGGILFHREYDTASDMYMIG